MSHVQVDLDDPEADDVLAHASLRGPDARSREGRAAHGLRALLARHLRREYVLALLFTAGVAVLVSRTFT